MGGQHVNARQDFLPIQSITTPLLTIVLPKKVHAQPKSRIFFANNHFYVYNEKVVAV
jgi:hypothetical protein